MSIANALEAVKGGISVKKVATCLAAGKGQDKPDCSACFAGQHAFLCNLIFYFMM